MWCTWQPHSHLNQAMAGRNDKADKVLTSTPPSSLSSRVCVWGVRRLTRCSLKPHLPLSSPRPGCVVEEGWPGLHSSHTFFPHLHIEGVRQREAGNTASTPPFSLTDDSSTPGFHELRDMSLSIISVYWKVKVFIKDRLENLYSSMF